MIKRGVVLGLALLVATSCSKKDDGMKSVEGNVANLKNPVSEVTVKRAKKQLWDPAQDNAGLNNYDSVKTGPSSSGIIKYSDHTKVDMGENTLVVVLDRKIKENNEKSVMGLPKGTIDGRLDKKTKKKVELVVRTSRGWIKATNRGKTAKVRFKATITKKGALRVTSKEGEVKVVALKKEKVVKQNTTVTVAAPTDKSSSGLSEEKMISAVSKEDLPEVTEQEWTANREVVQAVPEAVAKKEESKAETVQASSGSSNNLPPGEFKILSPKELKTKLSASNVNVTGLMGSKMQVFLNNEELKPNAEGKFFKKLPLNPGINLLTFQIVGPTKDKVRYETYEVFKN